MTRFVLVVTAIGLVTLAVAAGCSSSDSSTAKDGGLVDLSDADLSLGDGGRKASLDDSGACLASTGAASTCSDTCNAQCTLAVSSFLPDVAKSINDCLATASDCAAAATTCVHNAAAAACPNDGATTFCTSFLASCPDTVDGGDDETQSDCVELVRAMTDQGTNDLQTCVTTQGACAPCITALTSLTPPSH